MSLVCRVFEHGSPDYWLSVQLRYKILRHPLGLKYSKDDLIKEKDDIHVGLFSEEEILASLILSPQGNNTVKLRQVAVDDAHQGKGLGRELQLFAEEWLRKNGYQKIVCHARKVAVPFYEKQGFAKMGEEFTEVGIPHYFMEKRLA